MACWESRSLWSDAAKTGLWQGKRKCLINQAWGFGRLKYGIDRIKPRLRQTKVLYLGRLSIILRVPKYNTLVHQSPGLIGSIPQGYWVKPLCWVGRGTVLWGAIYMFGLN